LVHPGRQEFFKTSNQIKNQEGQKSQNQEPEAGTSFLVVSWFLPGRFGFGLPLVCGGGSQWVDGWGETIGKLTQQAGAKYKNAFKIQKHICFHCSLYDFFIVSLNLKYNHHQKEEDQGNKLSQPRASYLFSWLFTHIFWVGLDSNTQKIKIKSLLYLINSSYPSNESFNQLKSVNR
jgi:hypothetical protein